MVSGMARFRSLGCRVQVLRFTVQSLGLRAQGVRVDVSGMSRDSGVRVVTGSG